MNRTELLKRLMNKPVVFNVEGFGEFKVKGMNTMDYLFAAASSQLDEEGNMNQEKYFASLVVRCVMDMEGERIFKDEDLDVVAESDISFVLPLALKVQELTGIDKSGKQLKKN
ncbi:hypothetical protein ACLINM_000522 [Vibrio parahaemolyticus]